MSFVSVISWPQNLNRIENILKYHTYMNNKNRTIYKWNFVNILQTKEQKNSIQVINKKIIYLSIT